MSHWRESPLLIYQMSRQVLDRNHAKWFRFFRILHLIVLANFLLGRNAISSKLFSAKHNSLQLNKFCQRKNFFLKSWNKNSWKRLPLFGENREFSNWKKKSEKFVDFYSIFSKLLSFSEIVVGRSDWKWLKLKLSFQQLANF